MLFRIWQHALMEQPISAQEICHWINFSYGDELGVTSDDDNYVSQAVGDRQISAKLTFAGRFQMQENLQLLHKREMREVPADLSSATALRENLLTASSDTSEPEDGKNLCSTEISTLAAQTTCPVKHEGRLLYTEVFPMAIDDLFTLIFTYNEFNASLLETMKYTDVNIASWEDNPSTGLKMRVNSMVVPVNQAVGPKTCQVTETQVLQPCSKPGELYVIEVEAVNAGVPYAESFYINTHFCLTRVSSSGSSFTAHSQIKYRKSVWGLVKSFIEKNVWAGLEDFFKTLGKALEEECRKKLPANEEIVKRSQKRESMKVTTSTPQLEPVLAEVRPAETAGTTSLNDYSLWGILGVLVVLLFLNAVLYYKLSVLEGTAREPSLPAIIDTEILLEQRSHEQWVALLRRQTAQHQREIHLWQATLKSVVSLLKQAEDKVNSLESDVQTVISKMVMAAVSPAKELGDSTPSVQHSEL